MKQNGVNDLIGELKYPFSFLRSGEYDREVSYIPGQPTEDIGNFPDNIAEYFWIHPSGFTDDPWLTLCQLTNGVYVFYKGECEYTGFDYEGSMKIYASRDPNILLQLAMTEQECTLYKKACIASISSRVEV